MEPATEPDARQEAADTRRRLLLAAFAEIHLRGYQAASMDRILAGTGLTKGALYHHFPNKRALGLAVLDEVVAPGVQERWIRPLAGRADPIDALKYLFASAGATITSGQLLRGCPLNNLAQEMSPLDDGFRVRIERIYRDWRGAIARVLADGQRRGQVTRRIDPRQVAAFIVAAAQGCIGMAKSAQDPDCLRACGTALLGYLDMLRA